MTDHDDPLPDSRQERDRPDQGMAERGTPGRELPGRELLVAYLDGELDADEARHVEHLMASNAQVEGEVRQLERAWRLLDRLPRADVGPSFTESTVEMVALAVEDELGVARGKRRSAAWSFAMLAACILGFAGARLLPDPNRQLLLDLPVIDNVEAFRQTPDINFLRDLTKAGVFEAVAAARPDSGLPADRKKWLNSLDAEQKDDVYRKYERFSHLPADEQSRLRKFQGTIDSDAEAGQLTVTLVRFQQWLEQLGGVERAELMALDGEHRLQRVKRMRRDEARRLAAEDVQPFTSWFAGILAKTAPPDARAKIEQELAGASDDERTAILRRELVRLQQRGFTKRAQLQALKGTGRPPARPFINPRALAELEKGLSPHGQNLLTAAQNDADRRALVWSWANQAFGLAAGRGNALSLPDVDEDDLKRFFEQLSPVQRTHLLNLPADQMKRQLLARYQAKRAAEKKQRTPENQTKPGT